MNKAEWSEAIFGSFDGLVSVTGVIFGLLSQGGNSIIRAAIGLAIASAIGMGAGEFLADDEGSIRKALVMAAATIIGTIVPILAFLFCTGAAAVILAAIFTFFFATIIGIVRGKGAKGFIQTYAILVVAALITVLVSLLIPASVAG